MPTGLAVFAPYARAAAEFVRSTLHTVTWRLLLAAQAFGGTLGLFRYLEARGHGASPHLLAARLCHEVPAALFMTLAACAANEAVVRGWPVRRAFALALACAAAASVLVQMQLGSWLGAEPAGSRARLAFALASFVGACLYWGMAILVFLNRRSAARMLAGVRNAELERMRLERRVIDSSLASAEAQIDPPLVLKRLAHIRGLYDTGRPDADEQLEALIADLRDKVARARADGGWSGSALGA